ncbi:hypothetical protein CERSUDRAFT_79627 [Gelatoporia subvermispora B]|uniref:Uncharacterized protein n=1 Tax=Ceriporiopsis subvermispora (strain B) TaxID=914234 RepID=M2PYQ5_CERS8|nr:hypothetical protein CERSUDRAFT_79627 [Gelatoporia subvermispora B]
MSPTPISPGLVHLVLEYISPPSQLTQPLPPHLVSKSLAQRHHFLRLTTDFPEDYLCWPSSPERQSRAIECLETLPRRIDDEPTIYPVQYTSDGEYVYAHIDLSSGTGAGARLIFQWDDLNGWQYHDTNLMPFPTNSQTEPQHVTTSTTAQHMSGPQSPPLRRYSNNNHNNDGHGEDDDSSYWDSYGSHDPDSASYGRSAPPSAKDAGANTEDAYWARYSNVHGTADSTQPSPLPPPLRGNATGASHDGSGYHSPHPLPVPARAGHENNEEPLPIPPSAIPRPNLYSKWDPASPHTLARLLSTISPRESASPSPAPDTYADAMTELDATSPPDMVSPTVGGHSDTPSPPGHIGPSIRRESGRAPPPATLKLNGTIAMDTFPVEQVHSRRSAEEVNGSSAEAEVALRAGIDGLWKLWKAGRRQTGGADSPRNDEDDKTVFLRIVQDVVGSDA